MSQNTSKPPKKKRKSNPLIGIFLAVFFFGVSYLLAPTIATFLRARGVSFGLTTTTAQWLITALLFFVLFGIAMFVVSMLVGRDLDEDAAIKFNKEAVKRREFLRKEKEQRKERQREIRRKQR